MKKRINARCKDLLEVTATGKKASPVLQNTSRGLFIQGELLADDFFVYRVDFSPSDRSPLFQPDKTKGGNKVQDRCGF